MEKTTEIYEVKDDILKNKKSIAGLNEQLLRKTHEVNIIQEISAEIITSLDLDSILKNILASLERVFAFKHSMILLTDKKADKLTVYASHGYKNEGLGAIVNIGDGIIGVVAKRKKIMRMSNIGMQRKYMDAVKTQMASSKEGKNIKESIELPGLNNLESQVAIPLTVKDKLIGVLAIESDKANVFDEKDEFIITIIANQAASAIENAKLFKSEQEKLDQLNIAHKELKELNEQLEDKVKDRTKKIQLQKEIIEQKNKDITDSIVYSQRIQEAIMPEIEEIYKYLPNSFVLYKPKDIVSGDFYWFAEKWGKIFIAVVDCTGHGVPGAFMSMIGNNLLNQLVVEKNITEPSIILNQLHEAVMLSLKQTGLDNKSNDGMDIALCCIEPGFKLLKFSGAHRPLYVIDNNAEEKLSIIKGDKIGIGGEVVQQRNFTNHQIELKEGISIYMTSDGYPDQFGGDFDKKFSSRRFRETLLEIQNLEIKEQDEELDKKIEKWKGKTDQTDDITVIGIKFL
ncbi:SpoIIE family protein phosphatase [Bacteroidales bacterium AH-315-N07]|nr:SpoIIE family protein phosphatase [Bacteroidales bacterium AH-315-N07]